jgi:hypothetical protein
MAEDSPSMLSPARLRASLARPLLPVLFFFAGVTYDTITLTRIDRLQDNLILLLYLSLLGALIVLRGRADLARAGSPDILPDTHAVASFVKRAHPYYPHAIQFLLGGLFSAYTIFYSQSASLTGTAVFFAVLVALLVANELFKDRLTNLRFLVGLYALVCFSFFTFFLPVLTGFMNTLVFLLGAALSLAVTLRVVELVYAGVPDRSRRDVLLTGAPAAAMVLVLVGFYFLHWIPPVPLSLKFGGIYHQISKRDGVYRLGFEPGAWYQFWKRSDDPFHGTGPASCFTAVFAPVALQTTILHHWQHRPTGRAGFHTTDRIPMTISGGREAGYRGYTTKSKLDPGEWRVDVETTDGRVIGRVGFQAEEGGGEIGPLDTIER